tara:strand:- start:3825 stop:4895 length:1071 start_codon:yes stop_codon:yes gene_type:complete
MRILFSSSDAGSALQNNSLAYLLSKLNKFKFAYVSNSKIAKYYTEEYSEFLCVENEKISYASNLIEFLDNFAPKFIFVGISPNDNGIDYVITKIAKKRKIRTAAIQDYYGWVGAYNNKIKPDYFFVLDEYAKLLTKSSNIINEENIIITGSPKHYTYFDDFKQWDIELNETFFPNKELIFFLQPLGIKGVYHNFIKLCKAIEIVKPGYVLNIKLHPIDEKSENEFRLKQYFHLNIVDYQKPVEVLLLYFDNIMNCFSTIAYDYFFIKKYVVELKGSRLINLVMGEDIKLDMSKLNFDLTQTPQYQIATNIFNYQDLINDLEKIFNSNIFNSYESKDPKLLNLKNPVKKIISVIKGM